MTYLEALGYDIGKCICKLEDFLDKHSEEYPDALFEVGVACNIIQGIKNGLVKAGITEQQAAVMIQIAMIGGLIHDTDN